MKSDIYYARVHLYTYTLLKHLLFNILPTLRACIEKSKLEESERLCFYIPRRAFDIRRMYVSR